MRIVPPPSESSFSRLYADSDRVRRAIELRNHPVIQQINRDYRPWRRARAIMQEAGVDPNVGWHAAKLLRLFNYHQLQLPRAEGGQFGFCDLPVIRERLHRIDRILGGGGPAAIEDERGVLHDRAQRERLALKTMIDEAIESSRLEGAVTTMAEARELLRSGRTPVNEHERMVANNYAAMRLVKTWLHRDLDVSMLIELQRCLTRQTSTPAESVGRLRQESDPVRIVDERSGETVFTPPSPAGLEQRLEVICRFANQRHTGDSFIHPIVKACVIHFMIGYEHPFCDGNGRTARAIFYWYAMRTGYEVAEFLAVSELIRHSPAKYVRAYLNTELDDGDLTYFILYHLRIIDRAIDRLKQHLAEEEERIARSLQLARHDPTINLRQRLLLDHALRHPRAVITVKSHASTNRVTPTTARADLEGLVERGLFRSYKAGRAVHYLLSADATTRLSSPDS